MLYSDLLVLKFFRDIVVYEKITLIKKLFSPFNTVSHSMSPYTHTCYITHYITLEVLSVTIPLVLNKTLFKSLVLKQNFSRNLGSVCLKEQLG